MAQQDSLRISGLRRVGETAFWRFVQFAFALHRLYPLLSRHLLTFCVNNGSSAPLVAMLIFRKCFQVEGHPEKKGPKRFTRSGPSRYSFSLGAGFVIFL